jgi:hypothetical protein
MHFVLTSDVETKLCCGPDDREDAGTVVVDWLLIIFCLAIFRSILFNPYPANVENSVS